jgi:hypothetical protein
MQSWTGNKRRSKRVTWGLWGEVSSSPLPVHRKLEISVSFHGFFFSLFDALKLAIG